MVFYIGNHGWICKRRDSNFGKLENFEEHNFHKITKNMHFMLTILKVIYVLSTLMRWIMEGEKLEHVGVVNVGTMITYTNEKYYGV